MTKIYLGLGANVGNAVWNIIQAMELLRQNMTLTGLAHMYETRPFGYEDQANFYNSAVEAETDLNPQALRQLTKEIEDRLGRTRTIRNGPREIDIDILLYGDAVFEEEGLIVPHPGLAHRDFVIQPLLDLDPDLYHPLTGRRLAADLAQIAPADRYIIPHQGERPLWDLLPESFRALQNCSPK